MPAYLAVDEKSLARADPPAPAPKAEAGLAIEMDRAANEPCVRVDLAVLTSWREVWSAVRDK